MKTISIFLLACGLAAAQDSKPAADAPAEAPAPEAPAAKPKAEPKAEAPKADAPAAEEAKPEEKPAPKAEAKPKAKPKAEEAKAEEPKPEPKPQPKEEAKKEEPAKPKELSSCAKVFVPVADAYKHAYDDMQKWLAGVDEKTAAASAKVDGLQQQIEKNESDITKAKLAGDDGKESALKQRNKQLWSDLSTAKRERSAICSGYAREAIDKAKQFQDEILDKLKTAKSQAK